MWEAGGFLSPLQNFRSRLATIYPRAPVPKTAQQVIQRKGGKRGGRVEDDSHSSHVFPSNPQPLFSEQRKLG